MLIAAQKKIYIVDKFPEASTSLVHDINTNFAPIAEMVNLEDTTTVNHLVSQSDVVLNASGIGMYPHMDETPISKEVLRPHQIVFDATYNPLKTRLLQEAESIGCKILNGLGMVIHQGAIQFKLWTGKEEPVEAMTTSINKIITEMQK